MFINSNHSYHVKSEIGRGGMAIVHLAELETFDTNVALKVLNKEYVNNDNIRKRFLAEAKNMFRMSHTNIVKVIDLLDEGDFVAFAMEYIDGETLKQYLERKGRLSDEEIMALFTQMLAAVGYVHEQNLVHRDIKPSNFMLDRKGRIKLMDFGIAKTLDASSSDYTQTGTGFQMGTPMYMSPEQITETKTVTAQSDIYSLGVVLWQLVTGERPYDMRTLSNFQLLTKIVNDPLADTYTIWDKFIQKSTSKDASKRFNSCEEFLKVLEKQFGENCESGFVRVSSDDSDKTIIAGDDEWTKFVKENDAVNESENVRSDIEIFYENTSVDFEKEIIKLATLHFKNDSRGNIGRLISRNKEATLISTCFPALSSSKHVASLIFCDMSWLTIKIVGWSILRADNSKCFLLVTTASDGAQLFSLNFEDEGYKRVTSVRFYGLSNSIMGVSYVRFEKGRWRKNRMEFKFMQSGKRYEQFFEDVFESI
jgi:serine/threonine protein kinase